MRCKDAVTLDDFKAILEAANSAIRVQAVEDPELSGMGTTMTACAVRSGMALLAHVGDSRAYLVMEGAATRVSTDHSLAGQLIQSGFLKLEDAAEHPGRHAVIRCLGACDELEPELKQFELLPDDVLVLCTDGFWDQINDIEMAERFSATQDLMTVCEDLTRLANIRGGEDNITVVAALIEESDVS
jgi:protein phosphatase